MLYYAQSSSHPDLFHVVPISALPLPTNKLDSHRASVISDAFEWLIDAVGGRRAALQARIEKDVAERTRAALEVKQQKRLARLQKEAEEAAAAGKQTPE